MTASPCAHPTCSEPPVRRCYFCERLCCGNHITLTNGAICYACAADEKAKQTERAALDAEARGKASGCLLLLLAPVTLLLSAVRGRFLPSRRRSSMD
jgi:hypothetical protein